MVKVCRFIAVSLFAMLISLKDGLQAHNTTSYTTCERIKFLINYAAIKRRQARNIKNISYIIYSQFTNPVYVSIGKLRPPKKSLFTLILIDSRNSMRPCIALRLNMLKRC